MSNSRGNQIGSSGCRFKPSIASLLTLVVAGAFLLSSCSMGNKTPSQARAAVFDELRSEIVEIVDDMSRQQAALGYVDAYQETYDRADIVLDGQREKLKALNRDYDATREQFTMLIDESQELMMAKHQEVLALHRQMAAVFTDDEWEQLQKRRDKAVSKALTSTDPS